MSLSNYDIVYACSELFSIYIIYYFFQSLFGTQIRNKVITISVYALYFVLTIGIHFVANIPFLNLIFTIISLFSISLCYSITTLSPLIVIYRQVMPNHRKIGAFGGRKVKNRAITGNRKNRKSEDFW